MPSEYANELMGRVGLDTTDWKKGITELNAGIKHIETGFQATAALMDDWSHSSDGLKARVDSLNDKLALQKQKLDLLKKAYDEEVAANGASSKAAENLAKKMYATKADIEKTKESLNKYAAAEEEVTNQTRKMVAQLEKSGDKFVSVGDKVSGVGTKLTAGVTAPVIAAGAAIYKYGSDLTEAENKTEATFGYMSESVKKWAQNSLDSFGMAKATTYDAVSLYGDMATSMDISKSKAAEMSMQLVELSADLSSFKNISIDQAQNALKGIFTGETESLKNLGIVMTETQLAAYAMAEGFEKAYKDMSQAEKVQLRYQYVLDASSNAIGDYARTSGEAAGQMRKLPEALKELAASFNDNVAPVITPTITAVNNAIVAFGKLDDGTKKVVVGIAAIGAAIGPFITVGGKALTVVGKIQKGYALLRSELLKKTQATVADTAAEGKHAQALTNTNLAASKASKGFKGYTSAVVSGASKIAGAILVITALNAALEGVGNLITNSILKNDENNSDKYQHRLNAWVSKLNQDIEQNNNALAERENEINSFYDRKQSLMENDLKSSRKVLEEEIKLHELAHNKKISQLETERKLKLSNIDSETSARMASLQNEIDDIDKLIAAENELSEERETEEKIKEYEHKIAAAETYAEKVDAEKEYNAFLKKTEIERLQKTRQLQRDALQQQIDNISVEAQKKRDAVDEEYDLLIELEENKNSVAQEGFDNRMSQLDLYLETQSEKYEKSRTEELSKEQQLTTDLNETLKTRISNLESALAEEEKALEDHKEYVAKIYSYSKNDTVTSWISRILGYSGTKWIVENSDSIPEWLQKSLGMISGLLFVEGAKGIAGNAKGTDYWRGGLTWVNEEGGEIMNLPRGTQIIPHDVSMEMARAAARASVTNNNTSNHYSTNNYGAQQQVNVFSISGKTIVREIVPGVSVRLSNDLYGRRRSGGN